MITSFKEIRDNFPCKVNGYSDYKKYVQYRYTPGKRYRIFFTETPYVRGLKFPQQTKFTFQRDNVNYGICQKVRYGVFHEAMATAALWQALMHESKGWPCTGGTYKKFKFAVLDTLTGNVVKVDDCY